MIIGDVFVADWFFYALIGVSIFVVSVVVFWFYNARLKIGYKAVFSELLHGVRVQDPSRKELVVGGVRVSLGEKEFKASDKTVSWRGKEFKIDLSKPAYRWFGWTRFYYDFDSGNILTFGGEFQGLNPDDADIFMAKTLVQRMINALKVNEKSLIMWVVLIVVFSIVMFGMGLLSSPYILPALTNSSLPVVGGG